MVKSVWKSFIVSLILTYFSINIFLYPTNIWKDLKNISKWELPEENTNEIDVKEKFLKLWKLIIAEISLDIRCYVKYFNVKFLVICHISKKHQITKKKKLTGNILKLKILFWVYMKSLL